MLFNVTVHVFCSFIVCIFHEVMADQTGLKKNLRFVSALPTDLSL